jgi:hypothetical protein
MADAETQALIERLRRFHTSIIADCLDAVGATRHVVGPSLRPLDPRMTIAGVARPAAAALERAEHKTQGEDRTREEIAKGRKVADVFAELGIL